MLDHVYVIIAKSIGSKNAETRKQRSIKQKIHSKKRKHGIEIISAEYNLETSNNACHMDSDATVRISNRRE